MKLILSVKVIIWFMWVFCGRYCLNDVCVIGGWMVSKLIFKFILDLKIVKFKIINL